MKRMLMCAILLCVVALCVPLSVGAAPSGATPPKFPLPFLLSNAGQGPDGKSTRTLINFNQQTKALLKYESDYFYMAEPQPQDLLKYKTVIFPVSSTAKGLGASGITIDDEIARLTKVLAEAKKKGIKIVALLLKGKDDRGLPGSANERSLEAVAPYADYFIVRKDGDADGKLKKFAEANKAPITYFDAEMADLPGILVAMFGK